ncbi:MAG TPA: CPBP family intramembrane glutamic endopeptidase [Acidimicrobiia bacterium]|jgi:membrane protease YdiL (CAAX protease family)|nr:CPBP family intramembrane glutamic endopeptidase [Acidimicrobiia bacterium]
MTTAAPSIEIREEAEQSTTSVLWFVVLAHVLAWAWSVPLAIAEATVEQGQGWPTHVPSLLAPLLAAFVVVGFSRGRAGTRDLIRRMTRWRFAPVWWLVVVSPVVMLGLTLVGMSLADQRLPAWGDFAGFNGLPSFGVVSTFLLVFFLNGLGEETGWRGFLQDRLQRRFDPLPATLIVAVIWAVWHTPFFFILSTYTGFNAMTLVMFPLSLASGALVLTWLYNHTGRSILAVALWHTFYNISVATAGATDLIQGVVTAVVMVAATILVAAEIIAQRRGSRSVLGLQKR